MLALQFRLKCSLGADNVRPIAPGINERILGGFASITWRFCKRFPEEATRTRNLPQMVVGGLRCKSAEAVWAEGEIFTARQRGQPCCRSRRSTA
jgi:hypothetical protein